jgi:hypothetical protein
MVHVLAFSDERRAFWTEASRRVGMRLNSRRLTAATPTLGAALLRRCRLKAARNPKATDGLRTRAGWKMGWQLGTCASYPGLRVALGPPGGF